MSDSNQLRSRYADAILNTNSPSDAVRVLHNRINDAQKVNLAIADAIDQRLRIEARYMAELEQLSTKIPIHATPSGSNEPLSLTNLWHQVFARNIGETINASDGFVRAARVQIEKPLRHFVQNKNGQWSDIKVLEEGLAQVAHETDKSLNSPKRFLGSKNNSSGEQWESQAPYVFDQVERADEARVIFVKDLLTQYLTLEVDKNQTFIKVSEDLLNNVLSFDPLDDINSFAQKRAQEPPVAPFGQRVTSSVTSRIPSSSSAFTDNESLQSNNVSRPFARQGTDTSSINSDSSISTSPRKSKLRSKVGSIFRPSRNKDRKSSQLVHSQPISASSNFTPTPASVSSPASTPYTNGPTARLANNNTGSSNYNNNNNNDDYPTLSSHSVQSVHAPAPAPPPARKFSGSNPNVGYGTKISSGLSNQIQEDDNEEDEEVPSSSYSNSNSNSNQEPHDIFSTPHASAVSQSVNSLNNNNNNNQQQQYQVESSASNSEVSVHYAPTPPPTREEQRRQSTQPPFKVDIRQDAISEESHDADEALSKVTSTLRSMSTVTGGRGNRSNRRDIQSRLFTDVLPSDIDTTGNPPAVSLGSPVAPPAPQHRDSPEIHSLRSMTSTSTGGQAIHPLTIRHPDLTMNVVSTNAPLRSSIVELFNATIKEGTVVRAAAMGEIAFANTHKNDNEEDFDLRLVGTMDYYDRVVANPSVLQASTTSPSPYDYTISLSSLGDNTTVGLKYVYKSEIAGKMVPLIIMPIWRFDATQARLMLTYKLSENYAAESVTLVNAQFSVAIEGAQAHGAQSKPVGLFNRDLNRIIWRLDNPVTLQRGQENRLLCQFFTDGLARESAAGVDVKYAIQLNDNDNDDNSNNENGLSTVYKSRGADEDAWSLIHAVRSVVSGRVTAHS